MSVTAMEVKKLRGQTGAGIMDCKKALKENNNNFEKAVEWLRKNDLNRVEKKSGRIASEGSIASYIHGNGKIGVLIEVNSETDFAARNKQFQDFLKQLTMHITAMKPLYVKQEDIPPEIVEKEKDICESKARAKNEDKKIIDKIATGIYNKWLDEVCLLNQEFISEDISLKKKKVSQILTGLSARMGENIVIQRFVRFELGEGIEKEEKNFTNEANEAKEVVKG